MDRSSGERAFPCESAALVIAGEAWFLSARRDGAASVGRKSPGRYGDSKFSALSCLHNVLIPCLRVPLLPQQEDTRYVKVIHLCGVATPKPLHSGFVLDL